MANDRRAVRIVCVDGAGRILLLRWRDPVGERVFWEPPGGGVDEGEAPLQAARRELYEETGLPGSPVQDVSVPVERDFYWRGKHYRKIEPFYLARFPGTPEVRPAALTPGEKDAYAGHAWLTREQISELDALEPAHLLDVLAELGLGAR
jgi:8-oxo-dGTP diphosphatase